jgi:hypothetical protein
MPAAFRGTNYAVDHFNNDNDNNDNDNDNDNNDL